MDNDDIKLLLVRYITGEASEDEAADVKHWIGLHPENELYFVELYEAWQNMLCAKPGNVDEEKAYRLLLWKITPEEQPAKRLGWGKAAAVLFLAIVSAILVIHYRSSPQQESNQVTAQNGSVKKLILIDGTIVWLNAGSMLKYDESFGKTNRTVYLEGEAFFEIGHNTSTAPFLVKTKNYTIRDIGTKFNLKAYPGDAFFETTVVKGEVAVEGNADSNTHDVNRIYVKPRQVLKIYYQQQKDKVKDAETPAVHAYSEVRVTQVDSARMDIYDGWRNDLLIFEGNTLDEIARVLERRYNVKIEIDSPELQNIRYSGSFKNVPDIDKVLHIIKQNTPISYSVDGQKVMITKTN